MEHSAGTAFAHLLQLPRSGGCADHQRCERDGWSASTRRTSTREFPTPGGIDAQILMLRFPGKHIAAVFRLRACHKAFVDACLPSAAAAMVLRLRLEAFHALRVATARGCAVWRSGKLADELWAAFAALALFAATLVAALVSCSPIS